ncbi:hypothetical protein SCB49_06142 [unidentified eubacterium SCB49]|nr:hypothetical protein SCB49_06142 [unidentified eubacterium SCB49]
MVFYFLHKKSLVQIVKVKLESQGVMKLAKETTPPLLQKQNNIYYQDDTSFLLVKSHKQ